MTTAHPVIVGESEAIRALRATIDQVARAELPVLISGPTGAGKELVADALHRGRHGRGRFIALNICAVPEAMFEATLFGHVRGAFTGAVSDSHGVLAEADGGTLFLDEISGLPLALQAKLLRTIETGVFRPVGGGRDRRSDFRVVTATNEPLDAAAHNGRFRWDLLHRLSGIIIHVPSLNNRREDIPLLVRHFLAVSSIASGMAITEQAVRALQDYDWRGNVRELRHVLERSVALSTGRILDRHDMERAIAHGRSHEVIDADRVERTRLLEVMKQNGWDTAATAESLGVHRGTVYRWIRRLGISIPQYRNRLLTQDAES